MEKINHEENEKVVSMLKGLIDGARNKSDCKYISREILKYSLKGYDVINLEEELFYRKERWLLNLGDTKCLS